MNVGASSFADIVKGSNPKRSIVVCDPPPPMVISIDNSDLLKLDEFGSAILVKVRETVNLRYVGGLWVCVEFSNREDFMAFKHHEDMNLFFSDIKPFLKDFILKERVVWLEIGGLPLIGWSPSTFKKVASQWGGVMFFENDFEEPMALGRVCILTKILSKNGTLGGDSSSDDSDEDKISVADSFENMEVNPADKGPYVQHFTGHEEAVVKEPFKGLNTEGGDISQVGESIQSVSFGCSNKEGGSLFNELQRHIQLGQAMGFHMKGSKSDLKKVIME
ncbi:hypothetical protein L1987_77091 [Smallanthus sonchifolius]|uniref:Uncharacterized protein n=1 Tax=Smallanthus sonchifolius TaxID=185202 RepID=A0ACB8Z8U4_9ASTR|nr:hypothetical protein L1987_77091 [Smallanthus sonchifolius]